MENIKRFTYSWDLILASIKKRFGLGHFVKCSQINV